MLNVADDEVDEAPLEPEGEDAEAEDVLADEAAVADGADPAALKKRKAKKKQDPRLKGLSKDQKLAHSKIQNEEVARAVRLNQLMPYTMDEDWELVVAVKPRETTLSKARGKGTKAAAAAAAASAAAGEEEQEDLESQETENDWKEPWSNAFVNHVPTGKGGTHVDLVSKTVSIALATELRTKYKKFAKAITPALIRQHMWLFVNAVRNQINEHCHIMLCNSLPLCFVLCDGC